MLQPHAADPQTVVSARSNTNQLRLFGQSKCLHRRHTVHHCQRCRYTWHEIETTGNDGTGTRHNFELIRLSLPPWSLVFGDRLGHSVTCSARSPVSWIINFGLKIFYLLFHWNVLRWTLRVQWIVGIGGDAFCIYRDFVGNYLFRMEKCGGFMGVCGGVYILMWIHLNAFIYVEKLHVLWSVE